MARKISKELSLCHKIQFSNPYIYGTWWCKLLIFQTKIVWCNKTHSLKYLRSTVLGCRDIGIRKSEFVSKTQFHYRLHIHDSDWLNFINFLVYKYKIRLVSISSINLDIQSFQLWTHKSLDLRHICILEVGTKYLSLV